MLANEHIHVTKHTSLSQHMFLSRLHALGHSASPLWFTTASRSGVRLLLLLILAVAASGRFPLLLRPWRAFEEHPDCAGPSPGGWPIALQTLRIDLQWAHLRRATPPKVLGASPKVRRMRTVNLLPAVLLLQLLLSRRLAGRFWVKCYPGRYPRASLSNVTLDAHVICRPGIALLTGKGRRT